MAFCISFFMGILEADATLDMAKMNYDQHHKNKICPNALVRR